jgi:hypothetical protein
VYLYVSKPLYPYISVSFVVSSFVRVSFHLLSVFILSFTRQENNNMSGRKKARPNMSGRKKARPSFNEYLAGRESGAPVVDKEFFELYYSNEYPAGREPRASVVDKEQEHYYSNENTNEIIEEEPGSDNDKKELEKLRTRKFLAKILVAIFTLVLVIVLIVVIVSLTGTSDADGGTRVSPECVISNETTPETYQEFECDMIATLTTEDSTYLKTFASDTPHGKTIGWLTNDDDTDFLKTPIDEILERYVMALLYFSTVSNA